MSTEYERQKAAEAAARQKMYDQASKPTAYELQKQAEANARMKANPAAYQSQLPRSGSSTPNRGGGASSRQAAADAMARQQKAGLAKAAAQRALMAIPPKGPLSYQSKNPTYYDAVDFLAKKYGLNPLISGALANKQLGADYRERYGLTPVPGNVMKDAKGNIIKGAPVQPGPGYQGGQFGTDGVFMGYYDTAGRVTATSLKDASITAIEHTQSIPEHHQLVVPADAAKGIIFGWTPQKIAQFQKDRGLKVTGVADTKTAAKWSEGVNGAQKYYQFGGAPITPDDFLTAKYGTKKKATSSGGSGGGSGGGRGGGGGSGGGSGVGATQSRVTLTSRTDLQNALNQMFQDKLGRNATDSELTSYLKQVNSQERIHPQVATVDANGNSNVSGGVDPVQVAQNFMNQVQGGEVGTRAAGVDYFAAAMKMLGGGGL